MALTPNTIDVPLGNLSQNEPKNAGPVGRLTQCINAEVVTYDPPHQGGPPQRDTFRQRNGFTSLTTEIRDVTDGSPVDDDLGEPQLLQPLGNQLISITNSKPQVLTGSSWARYDRRVLTQTLSESVIHTTNSTIQAPDSAWLHDVECVVWNETDGASQIATTRVGFRSENGAWVVQPRDLFVGDEDIHTIGRVVQDGTYFWVWAPDPEESDILAHVYDTNGVELATAGVAREWVPTPGFWDVTAAPASIDDVEYSTMLVQPAGFSTGLGDVNVKLTCYSFDPLTVAITINTTTLTDVDCAGPVAFITNAANDLAYIGTLGAYTGAAAPMKGYEITNGTSVTHSYFAHDLLGEVVDAITGYAVLDEDGDVKIGLAASLLTTGPVSPGPPYDPALRSVVSWEVDTANVSTFVAQHNGCILQSRAFQVDDDFYAFTFYQSGGGLVRNPQPETLNWSANDFMTGPASQPMVVAPGDTLSGNGQIIASAATKIIPTQAITTITHNAGDSVVAATQTWTLLNAAFVDNAYGLSCVNSYLSVSGATPSSLNTTWRVISRPSATTIITENIGGNGTALVDSSLSGATGTLQGRVVYAIPRDFGTPPNGSPLPTAIAGLFANGTLTITGAANAGNNVVEPIRVIEQDKTLDGYPEPSVYAHVTLIIGLPFVGAVREEAIPSAATLKADPGVAHNLWHLANADFNEIDEGWKLHAVGMATVGNNGDFVISDASGIPQNAITTGYPLVAAALTGDERISVIEDPSGSEGSLAFNFFLQSATFDDSYLGGFLTVNNAQNENNNGVYVIKQVPSSIRLIVTPATGDTGQRNEFFDDDIVITVTKPSDAQKQLQPTWFVQPLSHNQQTVGRFEYGQAWADWRFDSEDEKNFFTMGLSSVSTVVGTHRVSLPYRAQSFTADQTVTINGQNLSQPGVLQTTVGIKDFILSFGYGEALVNSGTMLIPGPQASQFSLSGFSEQGVNLGFEQPFLVEQAGDAVPGLTKGIKYQYVAVAEATDENGDRVFSVPSLPLEVTLTGDNNQIALGGRMIGPTNRHIAISLYRTATLDGIPTTQHYKITNDLGINGQGFSFLTEGYNYSGDSVDTWNFTDTIADASVIKSEILYTDKGFLPRFPCPAFKGGAASWKNRTWVIGYDGAVWMSGEKTQGDALWFHPASPYTLPTDDAPVALAAMDDYLIILCENSYWYIPAAQFPDATGRNGTLPTPVQIQFQGGCSGFAVATKNGVAYENVSGGIWLLTRRLENIYLSQPIQESLGRGANVTGMTIDDNQRLYVSVAEAHNRYSLFVFDQVSETWWQWGLPSVPSVLTTYEGLPTYQDGTYVMQLDRDTHHDTRGLIRYACPPYYEFADLNFAGVRSFKKLWGMELVGTYKGPHTLHAIISYPDEIDIEPTLFDFIPDEDEQYIYEINPANEDSSTYGLIVYATFENTATPDDSFEFEMISAEVGLQKGMNKLPDSHRKPST